MFKNVDELDEIELLKVEYHSKIKKEQLRLIYEFRNYSHYRGDLVAKIFCFWR